MDSLTQMALGAAVAEATLGRQIGRRALFLGAALGTLPDLDVVISYADAVDSFTLHRSFSHSLFVLSLLSLPLSQLCRRWVDRAGRASAGRWWLGIWLVLTTHALLDGFTVYGTQLFWPLPVPPVAISSVFIIDPMYSLPLLLGLLLAFCWRDLRGRRANATGLIIAQTWLLIMLVLQQVARADVLAALEEKGVEPSAVLVLPLPLGMMWRVLALDGDDVLETWVSFVDGIDTYRFDRIPRHLNRLGDLEHYAPVQRLRWFTNDFVALRQSSGPTGDVAVMSDLRMGTITNPVFSFEIAERRGDDFVPIETRERLIYVCPPEIAQLTRRTVFAEPSLPVASLRGSFFSHDPDGVTSPTSDPHQVICE